MLLCSSSFWSRDTPAWMGRNEDSLLRAARENVLTSATRGGSCAHPDQSRGLARRRNLRAISGVGASSPILLFFIGGGVALHERLVGLMQELQRKLSNTNLELIIIRMQVMKEREPTTEAKRSWM